LVSQLRIAVLKHVASLNGRRCSFGVVGLSVLKSGLLDIFQVFSFMKLTQTIL